MSDPAEFNIITEAANALTAKVDLLNRYLTISRQQLERVQKIVWAMAVVIFVLAAVIGVGVYYAHKIDSQGKSIKNEATCIRTWANEFTKRTSTLGTLSTARTNALDVLVRTLSLAPAQAKVQFPKALNNYLVASNAYKQAVKDNPVPKSPTFNC